MKLKIFEKVKKLNEYTDTELQTRLKEEKMMTKIFLGFTLFMMGLAIFRLLLNYFLAEEVSVGTYIFAMFAIMLILVTQQSFIDAIQNEQRFREIIKKFTTKEGNNP